jgi:hypothetical protein
MNLHEINSHSVGDDLIFEMHELMKNTLLFENNANVAYYLDFINQEKHYTVDHNTLLVGNLYYPLGLQSVPVGETILIKYVDVESTYISSNGGKIYFQVGNKSLDFPQSRPVGDGFLETLVFQLLSDQQQFLSALKLKFNGWNIKVTNIT